MGECNETIICDICDAHLVAWMCIIFIYMAVFRRERTKRMVLLLLFAGAAVLLCRYTIYLPPNGNAFTLESSVYLALLFTHGLHFSLIILLISSFVMYFWYPRKRHGLTMYLIFLFIQ